MGLNNKTARKKTIPRIIPDFKHFNFSMIKVSLFPRGLPKDITFHRMRAETEDLNAACDHYSALFPDSLDVLLLSMGEDGHIASLFPYSHALLETERKVMPVIGPKTPFQRLTITPPVIKAAKQVYVLAIGDEKKTQIRRSIA